MNVGNSKTRINIKDFFPDFNCFKKIFASYKIGNRLKRYFTEENKQIENGDMRIFQH